jgi:hypothetical protein
MTDSIEKDRPSAAATRLIASMMDEETGAELDGSKNLAKPRHF